MLEELLSMLGELLHYLEGYDTTLVGLFIMLGGLLYYLDDF